MVLTVLLPSCTGNESSEVNISCVGCAVTLQQRRYEEQGSANQKWCYEEPGFLYPFQSNLTDKGKNSPNKLIDQIEIFFRNYCCESCEYLYLYGQLRSSVTTGKTNDG